MAKAPSVSDLIHNRNMRLMEEYTEMRDHACAMRDEKNKQEQLFKDLVYWSCTEPEERKPLNTSFRCRKCRAVCPLGVFNCESCCHMRAKDVVDRLRESGVLKAKA